MHLHKWMVNEKEVPVSQSPGEGKDKGGGVITCELSGVYEREKQTHLTKRRDG